MAKPSSGEASAAERIPEHVLAEIRRTRRHPRITQFDYAHLRRLLEDLTATLERIESPVDDALDIFCGSRPYDDLFPPGARCVGLDIDDRYGCADVISREFLPFEQDSFDLATCIEAFHYVEDPEHGVGEIRRVLRPGGTAVIAVPLVWEYDRTILEHRFTGPELGALFAGWEDVRIIENGGRGISWSTLTGRLINLRERTLPWRVRRWTRPVFMSVYAAVNGIGLLLDASERRDANATVTLPMNLLLSARRPAL